MIRRAVLASIAAFAAVLVGLPAPSAHAAAYRYWTYWQAGADGWSFASTGPAFTVPADGSVEGWSFRVSTEGGTESGTDDAAPTTPGDFAAVCGTEPAIGGTKKVALIVDPGSPHIAPPGELPLDAITTCVTIEADATGYDVLRSVVDVRTENGLICALGGYPAHECAPILDDAAVAEIADRAAGPEAEGVGTALDEPMVVEHGEAAKGASAPMAQDGASNGPLATILVVALLGIGGTALVMWRRREGRQAEQSDA